jgi:large subunit ribosomal protein L3
MSEANNAPVASNADLCAFYGQKAGMTRIFDKNGNNVPVTVIKLIPNVITQVKTTDKDGYNAYQVAYYEKRENLLNKPTKGHLKKAKTDKNLCRKLLKSNLKKLVQIFLEKKSLSIASTQILILTLLVLLKVKVSLVFMKALQLCRWSCFSRSHFHRTPGSIGNRATPGRVFKLKKMPGHMGDKTQTVQNLKVVELNKIKVTC